MCVYSAAQSCLTLCNPMDCSPPGSSVHWISQARILEWVAISFSRASSRPRDWLVSCVFCIGRQVLYHCASWKAPKYFFHSLILIQRIDALKLWCWGRLLRVPWTARRLKESILKEINPEYLLEGLMLKLQFFGHLMQRANSLQKTLILGKIRGKRSRWWQRMIWLNTSLTQRTWIWANSRR